ncbi:MAG: DUF445 family protein [Planctomycetes bacterium]|nr:DUF445 family protein [Planctomycetota bacterium]
MEPLLLFCLPVIGAGIGWFTNFLAVKMLFRPRRPVRILGLTFQGLVPKRQPELAERIGELVEKEFAVPERVAAILTDEESLAQFRELLTEKVDAFVQQRAGAFSGLLTAFVSDERMTQIKNAIVESVMQNIPEAVGAASRRLEERLDIRESVSRRIAGFDLDTLEEITRCVAQRELNHIQVLGGVLGFVIGLVQMGVVWLFL